MREVLEIVRTVDTFVELIKPSPQREAVKLYMTLFCFSFFHLQHISRRRKADCTHSGLDIISLLLCFLSYHLVSFSSKTSMLNLLSLRGYLCCRGHFVHHITLTSSLFNVELIGVTQLCYRLISSPFLLDRLVGQKVSMFKHKCVHHLICHTNPIRCPSQSHTRPSSGWQLCVKQCVPIRFMALKIFPPGPKRWTEKKSHELEHFHCNCARWGLENDRTAVMRDLTIKSRLKSITRWLWNVLNITEEFRPHQFWNVSVPFTWSLTVFRLPRRRPGVKSPCCDFVIWARFFNPWGPDASNAEPSLTSISHYFPSLSHTHTHTQHAGLLLTSISHLPKDEAK